MSADPDDKTKRQPRPRRVLVRDPATLRRAIRDLLPLSTCGHLAPDDAEFAHRAIERAERLVKGSLPNIAEALDEAAAMAIESEQGLLAALLNGLSALLIADDVPTADLVEAMEKARRSFDAVIDRR
jgi:hypothetical protein